MAGQRRSDGTNRGDPPELSGLLVLWLAVAGCVGLAIWAGSISMAAFALLLGIVAGWWTAVKRRKWHATQVGGGSTGDA